MDLGSMSRTATIWEDDSDNSLKGHRTTDNDAYDYESEEEIESEVPHAIEHAIFVGETENKWMQTASDAGMYSLLLSLLSYYY